MVRRERCFVVYTIGILERVNDPVRLFFGEKRWGIYD